VFGTPEKIAADRFRANFPAEPEMPASGRGRAGGVPPRANPAPVGPHAADIRLDLPVYSFSAGPHVLIVEVSNGRETARRDVRFEMR
jgi:hypothetical protein